MADHRRGPPSWAHYAQLSSKAVRKPHWQGIPSSITGRTSSVSDRETTSNDTETDYDGTAPGAQGPVILSKAPIGRVVVDENGKTEL